MPAIDQPLIQTWALSTRPICPCIFTIHFLICNPKHDRVRPSFQFTSLRPSVAIFCCSSYGPKWNGQNKEWSRCISPSLSSLVKAERLLRRQLRFRRLLRRRNLQNGPLQDSRSRSQWPLKPFGCLLKWLAYLLFHTTNWTFFLLPVQTATFPATWPCARCCRFRSGGWIVSSLLRLFLLSLLLWNVLREVNAHSPPSSSAKRLQSHKCRSMLMCLNTMITVISWRHEIKMRWNLCWLDNWPSLNQKQHQLTPRCWTTLRTTQLTRFFKHVIGVSFVVKRTICYIYSHVIPSLGYRHNCYSGKKQLWFWILPIAGSRTLSNVVYWHFDHRGAQCRLRKYDFCGLPVPLPPNPGIVWCKKMGQCFSMKHVSLFIYSTRKRRSAVLSITVLSEVVSSIMLNLISIEAYIHMCCLSLVRLIK